MSHVPKPGPAHERLHELVGTWRGRETMHQSPWVPEALEATGRTEARLALDGFAVIADYVQEQQGQVTYRGHGVYTVDPKSGEYVLHWFDSMGSPPEVFRGSFEGNTLVLGHGGPHGHVRLRNAYEGDRLTSSMAMSEDGTTWKPMMDGSYTRSS